MADTRSSRASIEELTRVALEHFAAIVADTSRLGDDSDRATAALQQLGKHYGELAAATRRGEAASLAQLADANAAMIARLLRLSARARSGVQGWYAALDESAAILPQLIEALQGQSDGVRGLDRLLVRIESMALPEAELTQEMELTANPAELTQEAELTADASELTQATASTPATAPLTTEQQQSDFDDGDEYIPSLDDTGLRNVFLRECENHLDAIRSELEAARGEADTHPLPSDGLLRSLHTLNGSAQTVGADDIVDVVQPLQRVALKLHRNTQRFDSEDLDFLEQVEAGLRSSIRALRDGQGRASSLPLLQEPMQDWVARHERLIAPLSDTAQADDACSSGEPTLDAVFRDEANELMVRLDRARGRVEAGEVAAIASLLAVLHTLKGSARMCGRNLLAQRAHEFEAALLECDDTATASQLIGDCLPPLRHEVLALDEVAVPESTASAVTGDRPSGFSAMNEAEAAPREALLQQKLPNELAATRLKREPTAGGHQPRLLGLGSAVVASQLRLAERLERLEDSAHEMELTSRRLHDWARRSSAFATPAARELLHDIDIAQKRLQRAVQRARREHAGSQRQAMHLQQGLLEAGLTRIAVAADRLERVVDDAAHQADRAVRFSVRGGEIRLDSSLWRQLQPLIEHLLRNAVVHGIESRAERIAAGKPAHGEVVLEAALDGPEVLLQVVDDGAGIDLDAINAERRQRDETPFASMQMVLNELCRSGYSSRSRADTLAGHGLGLAAVAGGLEALDGHLGLRSQTGTGSSFTMRVPLHKVVQQVLLLELNEMAFGIPVQQVLAVREWHGDGSAEWPESLEYQGQSWRSLAVNRLPGMSGVRLDPDSRRYCLLQTGQHRIALHGVDPTARREVLVQPMGVQLRASGRYLGGGVLADGRPILVLDLPGLLRRQQDERDSVKGERTQHAPRILLADDSITMRVAARRLLQSHGFEVVVARDGVEAVREFGEQRPDALLLDIEMPGLNGLQVLSALRRNHRDHAVPIILVSTRQDEEADRLVAENRVDGFVRKPWSEHTLLQMLAAVGLKTDRSVVADD